VVVHFSATLATIFSW